MSRSVAGLLLVACIAYVPWHDGGVAPASVGVVSVLVGLAAVTWIIGHAAAVTRPVVPRPLAACAILIILQGWWMAVNAHSRYDGKFHAFLTVAPPWPAAPGSVDGPTSVESALAANCVLAAFCIACDLGRCPGWRRRFVHGTALAGAAISAYGLARAAIGSPAHPSSYTGGTPFATFGYHGNAGAFLNLCLPGAFALFLNSAMPTARPSSRALSLVPLLIILAGTVVNVSRAAQVVTAVTVISLILWAMRRQAATAPGAAPAGKARLRIVLVLATAAFLVAGTALTTRHRWAQFPQMLSMKNSRLMMWKVCAHWLPGAGPTGYGPGTYKLLYPTSPRPVLRELYPRWIVGPHVPGEPVSIWAHVYNDYLQFAFEWGWLGAAAWLIILFGGFVTTARRLRRGNLDQVDRNIAIVILVAMSGLLVHALVDCPLQILSLQLYLAVLAGVAWGAGHWRRLKRQVEGRHVSSTTVARRD